MTADRQRRPGRWIWITWESHIRSRVLAEALGATLFELAIRRHRIVRYVASIHRTIQMLLRERPSVVINQNPSLILSIVLAAMRPLLGYRWIVDAHNEAVRPFVHRHPLVVAVSRRLLKSADLTIVSNTALAADVATHGGRAFVLPDGLPTVPDVQRRQFGTGFHIVAIATFAADEPIEAIIDAARTLPTDVHIHFTGNPHRATSRLPECPDNVHFLGYLPERDYWAAILGCDVVLDLSLMPDCLVCGAYEALAACKPMILTDNRATRELFGEVSIVSDPTSTGIRDALNAAIGARDHIAAILPSARDNYSKRWATRVMELSTTIRAICTPANSLTEH